jgi:hypothetical protein
MTEGVYEFPTKGSLTAACDRLDATIAQFMGDDAEPDQQ